MDVHYRLIFLDCKGFLQVFLLNVYFLIKTALFNDFLSEIYALNNFQINTDRIQSIRFWSTQTFPPY